MANPLEITLSALERQELMTARDTHTKAYVRERCAAILKIANGQSGHQVALQGLHKPRKPDTIYEWVRRYQKEGLDGLYIRQGRGRKAGFSP